MKSFFARFDCLLPVVTGLTLALSSGCATYYTLKPVTEETTELEKKPSVQGQTQKCTAETSFVGRKPDDRLYVWIKIKNIQKQSLTFTERDFSLSGPTMVQPPNPALSRTLLVQKLEEKRNALGARTTDKSWAGIGTILETEETLDKVDSETKRLAAEQKADQRDRKDALKEEKLLAKHQSDVEKYLLVTVTLSPGQSFIKWLAFDPTFKSSGPVKLKILNSECTLDLPLYAQKSKGV